MLELVSRSTAAPVMARLAVFRPLAVHARRWASNAPSMDRASFEQMRDAEELKRALSAVWAAGSVPSADVVEGMLRGARNVNDYALASHVLYELRQKIKKEEPYAEFINQLQPVLNELGIATHEELYGTQHKNRYYFGPGEGKPVPKED